MQHNRRVHPPLAVTVVALVGALAAYGMSSLLFAEGSDRVTSRAYLSGLALQGLAFLLAFLARAQLPLILVQATISASVAVTAIGGVLLGRWRLGLRDGAAIAAVVGGIAAVGASSSPSLVTGTGWTPLLAAAGVCVLALPGLLRQRAAEHPARAPGEAAILTAALLGGLGGLSFGSSAIAARMVAADPLSMVRSPIGLAQAGVLIGGLWVGQALLTVALRAARAGAQPGHSSSVTVPVSAVYIAGTLWPAIAGLVWLGDRLVPGRGSLAAMGLVLALAGVSVLSRSSRPQETPHPVAAD